MLTTKYGHLRKCFCLTPLIKLEQGGEMGGEWLSLFEIETSRGQASVTGRCPGGICRRSRSPTNSLSWKIENKEGSGEIEAVKYLEPILAIMTLDQDHYTPSRPFWVIMIVTLATDFFSYKKTIIIFLPHRCLIKSKLRRIGGVGWRTFPQLNNYKIREELNLCPKICRKQCLLGLKIGNVCQLLYFVSNVLPLESDSEWKRVSPFRGTSMEENDYQSSSPEVCFYFHSEWMQTNFDKVLAKLGLT